MAARFEVELGIPTDQLTPEVRAALVRLADENALLRAALAETKTQLGDLEAAAGMDPVTGLANAGELAAQLERAVGQTERHGTPAALIMIDLRGLQEINARHGRVAGDAALAHVARLLKGLIRTTDVAARLGGRFALLLDHLDPDSAIETGERIVRFIADQPLELGSATVSLDAIVGIATIMSGDGAEDVLARADRNLERMKEF